MTITDYLDLVAADDQAAELANPCHNADCRDDKPRQAPQLTVPQLVALLREACRLLAEAPCDCIWQDQPDGSQKHHPLCSLVRAREFLAREVQP